MAKGISQRIAEWVAEAQRRRVFRTAGVYIVAVWGISSGGVDLLNMLGVGEQIQIYGLVAAIAFLPVVVFLAWRFDIGLDGISRDPQDLFDQAQAEAELAEMPTMIGGTAGPGAVVVRWDDDRGENAVLFIDAFHIGRGADCRVRFYDPLVSRQHARIFFEGDTWYVEDLGSRNGTIIGGQPIERVPLAAACDVRLNDAGPILRIERIEPGVATQAAIARFPPAQTTAHVRPSATNAQTAGRGALLS